MSLIPAGIDPDAEVLFALNLAAVDTPDGIFRFLVGTDGVFRDVEGHEWAGCQLLQPSDDEFAIGGAAPSGSLTLAWFQDPSAPDLIAQVRELGAAYVAGRPITFYVQWCTTLEEMYAPTLPPVQVMRRTMREITWRLDGAQGRSLTLAYESAFDHRRGARRMVYNTDDHTRLIAAANPSLQFIPQDNFQAQKLFG